MPVYAWKGLNNAGKAVSGTKDADGPKGLRLALRKDGVYVTEHKEVLGGGGAKASSRAARRSPSSSARSIWAACWSACGRRTWRC